MNKCIQYSSPLPADIIPFRARGNVSWGPMWLSSDLSWHGVYSENRNLNSEVFSL